MYVYMHIYLHFPVTGPDTEPWECRPGNRVGLGQNVVYIHCIQWNLSNLDTLGTEESVLISEVS